MSGLIARFPVGGNTWSYLQYVLGLQQLGFDVYYLEDSVDFLCYNPEDNTTDVNPAYCAEYLKRVMEDNQVQLHGRWAYRIGDKCYGLSETEIIDVCRDAEVLLNVSGSLFLESRKMREEYRRIDTKVFIDTDPAYNQIKYVNDPKRREYGLALHDEHFTFGENIGAPDCHVPTCGINWRKTRQPIVLDLWTPVIDAHLDTFTTVTSWRPNNTLKYQDIEYGHKDVELRKFVNLPQLTDQKIELAMSGGVRPKILLDHGWRLVSGIAEERLDMWSYMNYLQRSRAEWSVAKNAYVATRCGWFSERSACYLASGKPVLVQDTGFSKYLPTGNGLFAFEDMSNILQGIDNINEDYEMHCQAARAIAEKYFDSRRVLNSMLNQINQ